MDAEAGQLTRHALADAMRLIPKMVLLPLNQLLVSNYQMEDIRKIFLACNVPGCPNEINRYYMLCDRHHELDRQKMHHPSKRFLFRVRYETAKRPVEEDRQETSESAEASLCAG